MSPNAIICSVSEGQGIEEASGEASSAPERLADASTMSTARQGSMTAFAIRVEERSDHTKADTDGTHSATTSR